MKVSDIIQTSRQREFAHLGGKGKVYYQASVQGAFRCTADTRKQAEELVVEAVEAQGRHLHDRKYYWSPSGRTVFVVSYANGWGYDIMRAGSPYASTCVVGDSFQECCEAAESHAAEYEEMD